MNYMYFLKELLCFINDRMMNVRTAAAICNSREWIIGRHLKKKLK